jgi:hypothetical protein
MGEMLIPAPNTVKRKKADNAKSRNVELVRHVNLDARPGILRIVALVCGRLNRLIIPDVKFACSYWFSKRMLTHEGGGGIDFRNS